MLPTGPTTGDYGFQDFLENLLALLGDENETIVAYAARSLRQYDNDEVRAGLLNCLSSCPPGCVGEVVATLEALHADRPIQLFRNLVKSPSAEVRSSAIDRLGMYLWPEDVDETRDMLAAETDDRCRASYLSLLGRLEPAFSGWEVAPYLKSEDPRVRANAVELLEKLPGPLDPDLVRPLLEDPAPRVRANAMRLLWPLESEQLWRRLCEELASGEERRELAAVYLLGQVPVPPEATAQLMERLESSHLQTRMLASKSLLTFQGPLDGSALCALYLKETSEPIRRNLMTRCRELGAEAAISTFAGLLSHHDQEAETRATAARALGDLRHPDAIPVLMAHLKDADTRVRANVIEALSRCPCEGMMDVLLGALDDGNNRVQATAALAVWRLGGHDAIDVLLRMLRSNDPKRQSSAAFALGEIGSTELVGPLTELLDSLTAGVVTTEAQRQVQKNVMRALTRIRSNE